MSTSNKQPLAIRCPRCNLSSYAVVQERKPDGKFGPSTMMRCVECKTVYQAVVDPTSSEIIAQEVTQLTHG